jgi:hypothetical protein
MGQEIFLFSLASKPTVWPTQPPAQWVPGPISPEEEWQERETEQSPSCSAEVKNAGAIYLLPHTSSRRCA